jgi:hypothetical protein
MRLKVVLTKGRKAAEVGFSRVVATLRWIESPYVVLFSILYILYTLFPLCLVLDKQLLMCNITAMFLFVVCRFLPSQLIINMGTDADVSHKLRPS